MIPPLLNITTYNKTLPQMLTTTRCYGHCYYNIVVIVATVVSKGSTAAQQHTEAPPALSRRGPHWLRRRRPWPAEDNDATLLTRRQSKAPTASRQQPLQSKAPTASRQQPLQSKAGRHKTKMTTMIHIKTTCSNKAKTKRALHNFIPQLQCWLRTQESLCIVVIHFFVLPVYYFYY